MINAIIPIWKPVDWTSFDVVKKIRSQIKPAKVGHAGTLDPFAEGILMLCTGEFTKRVGTFMDKEKEYIAKIRLGEETDTLDLTGKVIKTKKNTKKALHYMTLAAENGNMGAQQNLGTMYEEGLDPDGKRIPEISVDWKTALKWFHLSAKQGSELAKKDGKNLYKKMKNATN